MKSCWYKAVVGTTPVCKDKPCHECEWLLEDPPEETDKNATDKLPYWNEEEIKMEENRTPDGKIVDISGKLDANNKMKERMLFYIAIALIVYFVRDEPDLNDELKGLLDEERGNLSCIEELLTDAVSEMSSESIQNAVVNNTDEEIYCTKRLFVEFLNGLSDRVEALLDTDVGINAVMEESDQNGHA